MTETGQGGALGSTGSGGAAGPTGSGGALGPTGSGGAPSRPDIAPALGDLVVSGADVRLATAADGHAVVAVAALDGAITVSSWGQAAGAATGVEAWAPAIELAASAGIDDPLHGGYASTISGIQELQIADAGEAWLLYNRLQGTVGAGSRISIYLRHRRAGADLNSWDSPELVAEVGVGVVGDPVTPKARMAHAPTGDLIVAWSQRAEPVSARQRNATGAWGPIEVVDQLATDATALVAVIMDAGGVASIAWTRNSLLTITERSSTGWGSAPAIDAVGYVAPTTTVRDVMWLAVRRTGAARYTLVRYSRAARADTADLPLTGETVLVDLAADASGVASVLFSRGVPVLDGPLGNIAVLTYRPGAGGWSAPRDVVTASTALSGIAVAYDDVGAGAIMWAENQDASRTILRGALPDGTSQVIVAELPGGVMLSGVSAHARSPLYALWRFSYAGGYDVVVRWAR